MPALTIKNIPEKLYESLKESAKAHHRSINGEAIACLEKMVGMSRMDPEKFLARVEQLRGQLNGPKLTDKILRDAKERGRP